MKIGIISDTHDRLSTLKQAFLLFAKCEVEIIVHCGDWTKPATVHFAARSADMLNIRLMGVLGNRDDQEALYQEAVSTSIVVPSNREVLTFSQDSQRFAVYHGHHKPTLKQLIESREHDVLLTGHTHKPLIQEHGPKIIINPGSTAFTIPRRREPRSVALYDTQAKKAQHLFFEPE